MNIQDSSNHFSMRIELIEALVELSAQFDLSNFNDFEFSLISKQHIRFSISDDRSIDSNFYNSLLFVALTITHIID